MPAPEYIEHLMAWVQGNIDNESMFPSRIGNLLHLKPKSDLAKPFTKASTSQKPSQVSSGSFSNGFTGFMLIYTVTTTQ